MTASKGLHQSHQGVVNSLVAMGVVLAQDVSDDPGALSVGAIGVSPSSCMA